MKDKSLAAASLAAQAMGWVDPVTKAVVPPIHMASTYLRDEDNQYRSGRIYARADNPTFDQAETTLAALEGGSRAMAFSSGLAATHAVIALLDAGDHVVAMDDMYGVLVTMDYPDAMTGGLRRTTDAVRGILERTRGDLTVSVRQRELERRLSDFERRLS